MSGFAKLLPCGHLDWENCRCAEPDSLKKEPATDGVEVKGQNELPYYVQWEYGDGATRVQHTDDLATLFSDLRWALETARIDRVAISRNRNLHAAIPASAGSGSNASSLPETEKALEEKEPSTEAAHVLQNALGLMFDPDDPIGSFERTGELYYQDTGFLRPGKSEPMETGRDANDAENKDRFIKWLDGKRREVIADIKRILSSPATKSIQREEGDALLTSTHSTEQPQSITGSSAAPVVQPDSAAAIQKVLKEILSTSYDGCHNGDCLFCGSVNEIADHALRAFSSRAQREEDSFGKRGAP